MDIPKPDFKFGNYEEGAEPNSGQINPKQTQKAR